MNVDLNVSEDRLADALVGVIDYASRVLNAKPGSHYQWDKARQLDTAVQRVHDLLGGDEYTPLSPPVRDRAVEAAVVDRSRYYAIGKALYGTGNR